MEEEDEGRARGEDLKLREDFAEVRELAFWVKERRGVVVGIRTGRKLERRADDEVKRRAGAALALDIVVRNIVVEGACVVATESS